MSVSLVSGTYGSYYTTAWGSVSQSLTTEQQTVNVQYLAAALKAQGWTSEAIAGACGNFQSESALNPGRWQSDALNVGPAYGLAQWDPYTKYTSWAQSSGLDPAGMDTAVARLMYELSSGQQYYATTAYPLSFSEYIKSTATPEYLAYAWINNYERPADPNQPARQTQARYWYSIIQGVSPEPTYQISQIVDATASAYTGKSGDSVTITARDRTSEGLEFDYWSMTGYGSIANDKQSPTTFTFGDGDATNITAHFKRILFDITVEGGTAGVYEAREGTVTTITATKPGDRYIFKGWSATAGTIANKNLLATTYTFTNADATITAAFKYLGKFIYQTYQFYKHKNK